MIPSTDVYIGCDCCGGSIARGASIACRKCIEDSRARALRSWLNAHSFELTPDELAAVETVAEAIETGRPVSAVRGYSRPIGGSS